MTDCDVRRYKFLSTLITSPAAGIFGPKAILETTAKLNGPNYLLWTQAFRIFVGAQNKLTHLLNPPLLLLTRPGFFGDCCDDWLFNSLKEITI